MSDPATRRMTADEFIAWAMEQPEGTHYELCDGEIVTMAPERSLHALTKAQVWRRLTAAVEAAGLPCDVYPDGMSVAVDETTVYEPDVLLRCGPRLPGTTVQLHDPLIVVEVLSPSTRSGDSSSKLIDYFRLPSLRHYLTVCSAAEAIIQHSRKNDGTILTRIVWDGSLQLDPPGITVSGLFPPPR